MEYKVGDKVVVRGFEVEIKKIYDFAGITLGRIYEGILNNETINFNDFDIDRKIIKYKYCEKCKYYVEEECINTILCTEFSEFEIKKEKNKYLKTWEAIKALEEGKKIACDSFKNEINKKNNVKYWIKKDDNIINNNGDRCCITNAFDKVWYIYEETKKEIPKEFEGLKYILGSINNMDCGEKDCDKCPLGMEKCDMLDEIFFDMKEKYNF